jgi:hypothetical protein
VRCIPCCSRAPPRSPTLQTTTCAWQRAHTNRRPLIRPATGPCLVPAAGIGALGRAPRARCATNRIGGAVLLDSRRWSGPKQEPWPAVLTYIGAASPVEGRLTICFICEECTCRIAATLRAAPGAFVKSGHLLGSPASVRTTKMSTAGTFISRLVATGALLRSSQPRDLPDEPSSDYPPSGWSTRRRGQPPRQIESPVLSLFPVAVRGYGRGDLAL